MKETEFEAQIVSILNDCISDDYTDLEKVMALYEYMCSNYTYDYDMNEQAGERSDELSAYRCLIERKGICCEIASLYNYLLLQVGIDSETIGGATTSSDVIEGHSWVLVTIDGQHYHVDPTWGMDEGRARLHYFLMTDEARVDRDSFDFESMDVGGKADEITLKGVHGQAEMDIGNDCVFTAYDLDGSLEINQIGKSSIVKVPNDLRFKAVNDGRKCELSVSDRLSPDDGCEDFIELNGMKSRLTIEPLE